MQELKRRDEELQDRFEPAQVNLAGAAGAVPNRMTAIAPRSANTMDEQFPTADLKADDERDKVMAAKLALQTRFYYRRQIWSVRKTWQF